MSEADDVGGPADPTAGDGRAGMSRSAGLMAAGTAVSRVTGVVRGAVLVGAVGVNAVAADAFAVANWLPTMLSMLVAGGVLNAVLVPAVVRAYRTDKGQEFVDRLLSLALVLLLGITILLTAGAPLIVRLSTGSGHPETTALATAFALWCIPQVFFYGLYTLLGQILNARGSFGPYMWAPVANNVVSIVGFTLFMVLFGRHSADGPLSTTDGWEPHHIALLGGVATLGIVAQALVLIIPLYRSGFRFHPRWDWRGAGLGGAGRVAGWTFAALVIGQIGALVVTRVAQTAGAVSGNAPDVAGNAAYNNAFAVFILPNSLVTISLLTALFTQLSAHAAAQEVDRVRADVSYGLRTITAFTVIASAVLMVLAVPLVRVVLPATSPAEAGSLAPIIVALTSGLTAVGIWSLCQRVYYAYEDTKGLFWIQVTMAGVVMSITVASAQLLPVRWWVAGAGVAIAVSYVLGAVWGIVQVRRRVGGHGGRSLGVLVRSCIAGLVASAVGWPVARLFGDPTHLGFARATLVCIVVGTVMLALYVVALRLMKVTELEDLARPLLARLTRTMGVPARGRDRLRGASRGGDRLDVVVGRGTLLARRYRLDQPVPTDLPGVDCWHAQDQILDRPVRALVLREGRVRQAQDAARRAALVTDPRLLRILDVGDHEGLPYVVTERPTGRTLTDLTSRGPLPADQARAIIGEAAVALEVARRRGVHHLALRPSAVHVTAAGAVIVSGLAMDGELAGHGLGDARSTTRADTVALVALLYLTLTGRWPAPAGALPQDVPVAPVVEGSPVAPADLAPGVPNDLDTLCAVTLGPHDDGPHSPAELVRELEPWGGIAAQEMFGALDAAPAPARLATAVPSARLEQGSETATAERGPVAGTDAPVAGGVAGAADRADGADETVRTVQRQSVRSTLSGAPIAAARPGTPPPAIPPPFHRPDPRTAEQRTVESGTVESQTREARSAPSSPSGARPAAPNAVAAGMGSAGRTHESLPAASAPTPGAPVRVSSGRPASQPPAVPVSQGSRPSPAVVGPPSTPPARPAPRPTPAAIDPDHKDFDTLIGRSTEILTTRRFDPTPIVLGLVALAVVIGLVLAWKALTAPASIGDGQSVGTTSGQGTTAPSGEATQPADDGGEAPAAVLPVIASAQMIDPPPDGDNNEHPEAVPLALDGDPATAWYSRTYASPTFGMKAGIGYAVTLQAPATVTTVTLTVNGTGGMVEVRATDPATPTAGDVLASGALSSQTVLTLSAPTQTQTIVLWFTALPQTADGANRLELAEVAVS